MEIELWEKKLALFLDKSEWKEIRMGQALQHVQNKRTGDRIVFVSHSDSSDKNRRHMQGYVANYVWLDEMPSNVNILEELQRRVDARKGYLLATFTPKFRNDAIRKVVDSGQEPIAKKYSMSKLDNPLYADRLEEEIKKLEGYSDAMKEAILYGAWYTGESSVYEYTPETMEAEPAAYSQAWRHVVAVDPALKSKFGFTLWAEEPKSGIWYLVRDDYIEGIYDPEAVFVEVEKRIEGYNIVRRISDPHEAWFIGTAAKHSKSYIGPYDKNSRKNELIKNLQLSLSQNRIKIAPWCTRFKDEIQSCQWSETSDRIVNSSSYHTLDSAQYFCDLIPKYEGNLLTYSWEEELRKGNQKRKQAEHKVKSIKNAGRVKPIAGWQRRGKNRLWAR